jgi:uncharacterized protein (TIGR02246 family)
LRSSPRAVAESYLAAEGRRDLDAVLAHYAEDAVLVRPDGGRCEGAAAIGAFYEEIFAALAEIDVRLVDAVESGERLAVEWRAEVVATDGAARTLRGVNLVTVRDGRFVRVHVYVAGPGA